MVEVSLSFKWVCSTEILSDAGYWTLHLFASVSVAKMLALFQMRKCEKYFILLMLPLIW